MSATVYESNLFWERGLLACVRSTKRSGRIKEEYLLNNCTLHSAVFCHSLYLNTGVVNASGTVARTDVDNIERFVHSAWPSLLQTGTLSHGHRPTFCLFFFVANRSLANPRTCCCIRVVDS